MGGGDVPRYWDLSAECRRPYNRKSGRRTKKEQGAQGSLLLVTRGSFNLAVNGAPFTSIPIRIQRLHPARFIRL